jgi:NADPH-dependent 2,4-dienoyl-CoA reductase/sulfur reductase-like enzyme
MTRRQLVIVGAGPAGMSAAIAGARAGLHPVLIDDATQPGGQIYRQPPAAFPNHLAKYSGEGNDLFHQLQELRERIDLRTGTGAWGIFPPRQVALIGGESVEADHLILAPGAHEYLPPFPGWTLPGVMTPGGAQALVKTQGVLPGKRALVCGTGPFLLVVAEQLRRAGMEVAAVLELAPLRESWWALWRLVWFPRLLSQGLGYLRRLRRLEVPILRGHVLLAAHGDEEVRAARYAPCDVEGHPDLSSATTVEVDTICAGYGFVPRIQLAQLAGCQLRFDDARGGWVPVVDETLETSVPNVWVAGDGGGVAGVLVACLQGTLAGLAVACRAGALSPGEFERQRRPLARQLARLARFRAILDRLYRLRPGLASLAAPSTIVCRCEEVTLAEVQKGLAAGGTTYATLKVMTRVGMGPCQGQMCWPALARQVAQATRTSLEDVGPLHARPPLFPVSIEELARVGAPVVTE